MKSILIVDDSRTTRNYHAAITSSAGYDVVTANDGSDGLEKMLDREFDLILTDINMQGIDGYEFIRRVRSAGNESVPIIIISTESQAKDQSKGYAAGANLYIIKPSEPDLLLGYVRMMLGETS